MLQCGMKNFRKILSGNWGHLQDVWILSNHLPCGVSNRYPANKKLYNPSVNRFPFALPLKPLSMMT
jgi:hypothetical protein